jgi:hypothetical protein
VATTTDNCAGTVTGTTSDPLTYTSQGTFTVNWTFDDGNGNTTQASQTVIVDDVTPPATPNLATITGACSATVPVATTTDNCAGTVTGTTNDPLTYTSQGTFTVNWTFNDGNGNTSQASQTVVVEDVTPPTALCQNITVQLDANGNASITAAQIDNGSSDNCGIQSISVSQTTFTAANLGPNTVTLTVTDVNGLVSTCDATVTVTGTAPCSSIAVTKFYVVKVGTNQDLFELVEGGVISKSLGAINIRAEVEVCGQVVNSVRFNLTGALTRNQLENLAPWALAGDNNGNYNNWSNVVGSYTLQATPFPLTNGQGQAGTPYQINFQVINAFPAPTVTVNTTPVTCNGDSDGTATVSISGGTPPYQISWSTGETNQPAISGLGAGHYSVTVVDNNNVSRTRNFSIMEPLPLVATPVVTDASDVLAADGSILLNITGGVLPYAVSWNTGSNANPLTGLLPGGYSATVTDGNGCQTVVSATVNVATCAYIRVVKFYVVSVATNQDLFELLEGGVISRTLGDVNIRAEVEECGLTVESVRLRLIGASSRNQIENAAPWALAGDVNGVFNRWSNQLGNYTLTGTPYTLNNAQGQAGTPYTVNVSVISGNHLRMLPSGSELEPAISIYPNPAVQQATISLESLTEGMVDVQLVDKMGRIVLEQSWEKTGSMVEGNLNLEGLAEGIYFVKVRQGDHILTERLVKVQ